MKKKECDCNRINSIYQYNTLDSYIIFPKDNLENHKINLFARQLCSDIRYVRRINMFSNYNTYIYYINQGKHEGYVLRKDGKNIKSIMLPKNAKIARSIEIIKFKSDGSPQRRLQ